MIYAGHMPNTMWKLDGNCKIADPELFDPDAPKEKRDLAKRVYCYGCPVAQQCYDSAMVNAEQGVWGGTDDWERSRQRTIWLRDNNVQELKRQHENYREPELLQKSNRGKASVEARYDRRLQLATKLMDRVLNDPEAQDIWTDLLELMINNPTKTYEQLAARFDKGPTWYKRHVTAMSDRYNVSITD